MTGEAGCNGVATYGTEEGKEAEEGLDGWLLLVRGAG